MTRYLVNFSNVSLVLDKVNLISINNQTNSINYTYNNYNINLSIRFSDELILLG